MKENDICNFCKKDKLEIVLADEPWHTDYLICPTCDGTYVLEACDNGSRSDSKSDGCNSLGSSSLSASAN